VMHYWAQTEFPPGSPDFFDWFERLVSEGNAASVLAVVVLPFVAYVLWRAMRNADRQSNILDRTMETLSRALQQNGQFSVGLERTVTTIGDLSKTVQALHRQIEAQNRTIAELAAQQSAIAEAAAERDRAIAQVSAQANEMLNTIEISLTELKDGSIDSSRKIIENMKQLHTLLQENNNQQNRALADMKNEIQRQLDQLHATLEAYIRAQEVITETKSIETKEPDNETSNMDADDGTSAQSTGDPGSGSGNAPANQPG